MHEHKDRLEPRLWNLKDFEKQIIDAVKRHDIPSSHFPKTIDLSLYEQLFKRMLEETMTDPEKRERATYAKVPSWSNDLIISDVIQVGTAYHYELRADLRQRVYPRHPQYTQSEYAAFDIHTHGIGDSPPSPEDIVKLLRIPEEGGVQATFVLTDTIKFLIMRTMDSEALSEKDAELLKISWEKEKDELFRRKVEQTTKTQGEIQKISVQNQMELLTQFCQKHHLMLYVCRKNSTQFSRVTG